MGLVNTNDTVELTCFGRLDNQAVLNVFHYRYESDSPVDDDAAYTDLMQNLIQAFRDTVWAAPLGPWRGAVAVQYTLERIRAQKVNYPPRRYFIEELVGESGAGPGTSLPSQTQLRVTMRGFQTGKGLNGGKMFAGIATGTYTLGIWNNATQAAWQAVADNLEKPLVATLVPVGFKFYPVVWSPRNVLNNNRVRAAIVQPEVRTANRRVVGRGI
jgi:hypothetical protein